MASPQLALPVTSLCAGYLGGLLLPGLALPVGLFRLNFMQSHGPLKEGTDPKSAKLFERLVRAHGNATEYISPFLMVLANLEGSQVLSHKALLGLGLAFSVARTAHSLQLAFPETIPFVVRPISYTTQILLTVSAGGLLVAAALKALRK